MQEKISIALETQHSGPRITQAVTNSWAEMAKGNPTGQPPMGIRVPQWELAPQVGVEPTSLILIQSR